MIHIPDTDTHTVAVYRQQINIITLPEEYLPENTGKCLVLYANNGLLYLDPNWNTMADFTTVSTACQNNYDMLIFIGAGSDDYYCDKVLVSSCREYTKVCTLTTDTIVYTLNENGNWTSAPVDHSMSWNELKDKPFGEVPAIIDYYPETTWNGSGSITNGKAYLTYGTTYYVTWDGTEYECVCKGEYMTTYPCIGNASLFYSNGNQNTGEPFCIVDYGTSFEINATTEGDHTFSIKMVGTETKTIEDEYVPESIARTEDLSAVAMTGSWNDLTDKPFETLVVKDTIIQQQEIETHGTSSVAIPYDSFTPLTKGVEYCVLFDGVEYNCTAETMAMGSAWTGPGLGNAALASEYMSESDYPFCILTRSGYEFYNLYTSESETNTHTIEISIKTEECKTLEETYIPASIQRVGDDLILNSSTEGSTKKFKLTIDDSGVLTATEIVE